MGMSSWLDRPFGMDADPSKVCCINNTGLAFKRRKYSLADDPDHPKDEPWFAILIQYDEEDVTLKAYKAASWDSYILEMKRDTFEHDYELD